MIVASPLKRTIYTALYSFPEVIAKRQITVVALPELQETSNLPCDTGSDPDELSREFSGMPVDLSLVHNGWNNKQDRWAPTSAKIEERSQKAREWLRDQKASSIVVVTHGGLLHYLTEDWSDMDKTQGRSIPSPYPVYLPFGVEKYGVLGRLMRLIIRPRPESNTCLLETSTPPQTANRKTGTGWANTEFRSYTYSPVSNKKDDAYATIVETEESRVRRRGLEKPLSPAEQTNLRRTANNDLKEGNVTNSNAVKIASKV